MMMDLFIMGHFPYYFEGLKLHTTEFDILLCLFNCYAIFLGLLKSYPFVNLCKIIFNDNNKPAMSYYTIKKVEATLFFSTF